MPTPWWELGAIGLWATAASDERVSPHRRAQRHLRWVTRAGRLNVVEDGLRILGIEWLPMGDRHYADRDRGSMPQRYDVPMDAAITA